METIYPPNGLDRCIMLSHLLRLPSRNIKYAASAIYATGENLHTVLYTRSAFEMWYACIRHESTTNTYAAPAYTQCWTNMIVQCFHVSLTTLTDFIDPDLQEKINLSDVLYALCH